jgi:hypothetical protein
VKNRADRGQGIQSAADHVPPVITDLQVVIPHRTPELTRAALKYSASLAGDLNVRIRLIDVHVVPYGVPIDAPTVNPKHLTRRLRQLALESTLPVSAEVVYARDWELGFRRSLAPGSVIVMAMKRSWWPTKDKRLAARMRNLGHQVMWVECE